MRRQGGVRIGRRGVKIPSRSPVRFRATPEPADTVTMGSVAALLGAVGRRRTLGGVLVALVGLPVLTAAAVTVRGSLDLADDLLLYLVAVVAATLLGGLWAAVVATVLAFLLLNWFLTPPLHTLVIDSGQDLLALVLFLTVALFVGTTVHLAARRSAQADSLLLLATTVLRGEDDVPAVLGQLRAATGLSARLVDGPDAAGTGVIPIRPGLALAVDAARVDRPSRRILRAYAAQAAAALDRQELRRAAADAAALEQGNRMRTALLAAVSHDLRTPLATVKASVSGLRLADVDLSPADRAALLATVEEGADRLDALIGNLLDMSRLQTDTLVTSLRPTALDEVAPMALRGLDGADRVDLSVPETLPLVDTDPGLLERVLANLLDNALRHSPAGCRPLLVASAEGGRLAIRVVDHGPGVPAAHRTAIFEPFQRLGDRGSGVGLGLAVARGFVEALHGTLTASDTPGGGLTMTVLLPLAARP